MNRFIAMYVIKKGGLFKIYTAEIPLLFYRGQFQTQHRQLPSDLT
jgi:hypothetical protein